MSISNVRTARGPALSLGVWSHLAATYDGSALRLYVNGTLAASTDVSGRHPRHHPILCRSVAHLTGLSGSSGEIDEVRVYNRALTGDELRTDMSTPVEPDTQPPTSPGGLTIIERDADGRSARLEPLVRQRRDDRLRLLPRQPGRRLGHQHAHTYSGSRLRHQPHTRGRCVRRCRKSLRTLVDHRLHERLPGHRRPLGADRTRRERQDRRPRSHSRGARQPTTSA